MRGIVTTLAFVVLLLTAAVPAFAQKEKADNAPKTLLKIPVWVEEGDNQFWLDGKRQTFKVFVEEKESPVKSFQTPKSSTILLVVFDTVADLARVDEARLALTKAIHSLGQNYWIGLLKSQDGLSVIQEPTADRKLLAEKIQTIQVSGHAGLLDTLEQVSTLAAGMMQKANVRVAVLYVTDSGIANYRADYLNPVVNSSDSGDLSRRFSDRAVQEQMTRQANALGAFTAPIFILHLSYRTDSMNLAYQSGLERIAAATGGLALFSRTSDDIEVLLKSLLTRIQSSYFLGVEPPTTKGRAIKLRVEAQTVEGESPGKITYREQISMPKK
ncbi:MAG: hypothetical protein JST85_24435 [Acidobacteria bacterium]|nr:hypothetical protein [Acidobacteriota bacterium]